MQLNTQRQDESEKLLVADSIDVTYETQNGPVQALRDVSISIRPGETLGIAGESGSGKSTLALAILQYLDDNGRVESGSIRFKNRSLLEMNAKELRSIRGNQIAHVPQDPKASLNPSVEVGEQIKETILQHQNVSEKQAHDRTIELLETVGIPDPEFNATQYPHKLSGGMQQRVLVAIALSCSPELLILDEPTTGLDVTTQAKILDLINDLKEESDAAIILITHNLSVIAQTSDTVGIMYAGEVLERGSVEDVFQEPANPYTQGLLAALPSLDEDKKLRSIDGSIPDLTEIPEGCIFADRCEYAEPACRENQITEEHVNSKAGHYSKCRRWKQSLESPIEPDRSEQTRTEQGDRLLAAREIKKHFGRESFFDRILGSESPVRAVDGVDLDVYESETIGVVGESGCGKSTLGQLLLKLLEVTDGSVQFRGENIASLSGSDLTEFRSENQVVFQNPHSSLNPRKRINQTIDRPLKRFTDLGKTERKKRVVELLQQVDLDESYRPRYPHELSGGEKQRVAIARAFAADPAFIVLDEPVSALDVSVQANLLNLLSSLQEDYGSAYLFISHDLSVVKHISDRIAVMYLGEVVEVGPKESVFRPPYHPYTRALLSNIPPADPTEDRSAIRLEGDVPSARDPPSGCPFQTRCPQKIGEICETEHPGLERSGTETDGEHRIACHLDESEMSPKLHESDLSEQR